MVGGLPENHPGVFVSYRSQLNDTAVNNANSTLACPGSTTSTSKARRMASVTCIRTHVVSSSFVEGTSVSSVWQGELECSNTTKELVWCSAQRPSRFKEARRLCSEIWRLPRMQVPTSGILPVCWPLPNSLKRAWHMTNVQQGLLEWASDERNGLRAEEMRLALCGAKGTSG